MAVDKLSLTAPLSFGDIEEEENLNELTLFEDHPEGEGLLICPRLILRMEGGEGRASIG